MPKQIADGKKIVKNTVALYCRMILTMIIGLYTSRIVLQTLGVVDFGIYSVVGSVVVMFSFLNGTMAATTQRYLSFFLGVGDFNKVNKVFNATLAIHVIICAIVILIAETFGLWFLNHRMNIPSDRISVANFVYQMSVIAAVFSITQVPYTAVITAREKMDVYAYISIVEASLKLVLVLMLFFVSADKLKLYSFLVLMNNLVVLVIVRMYCVKKFAESKIKLVKDRKMYVELLSYSGWNLSSHIVLTARTQGVNVLMNLFLGPSFNAARGIAVQVNEIVFRFVRNFQIAAVPQITKLYADKNISEMKKLICSSSKISFMLLAFLVLPIILETEFILKLWLGAIPEWCVVFCRLTLIASLVDVLSGTLVYGALAVGVVKKYHMTLDLILVMNFVFSYVFLKNEFSPVFLYYIEIVIYSVCLIVRLIFLKSYIGLPICLYLKDVVMKDLLVIAVPLAIASGFRFCMEMSVVRFFVVSGLSCISICVSILFIGVNKFDREKIVKKVMNKFSFLIRRKNGLCNKM